VAFLSEDAGSSETDTPGPNDNKFHVAT